MADAQYMHAFVCLCCSSVTLCHGIHLPQIGWPTKTHQFLMEYAFIFVLMLLHALIYRQEEESPCSKRRYIDVTLCDR